ncbi:MAG: peptide ABC transporter substrate-binding protein [Planctomycetota bacterium]
MPIHRHAARTSRRLPFLLLILLLPALALTPIGCPSGGGGNPEAGNGRVLNCDLAADPEKLDPATMTGVPEGRVVFNVFEGLFMPTPDGELVPGGLPWPVVYGAAESHTVSDDQLTWTFKLRANGKWHNGDPVTANDFVYAWKRVLTMNTDYAEMMDRVKNAHAFREKELTNFDEVGFKVIDPLTLSITLADPCRYLPELLAFYSWFPVNQKVVEQFGEDWTRVEHYVGNGAFKLTAFAQKAEIVLEKFSDFHDAASVKLDKVVLHIIVDATARETRFETGGIDMLIGGIDAAKIDKWRGNPAFHVDNYLGCYFYRFNCAAPALKDKRVRHALSLAIDRDSLCRTVWRRTFTPATGFVPPIEGYKTPDMMRTDVEAARKLLAEAGYKDGADFPRLSILFNTDTNHERVAVDIQQQWKTQLGINVDLEQAEWKTVLDRVDKMNFLIERAGWIADWTEPDTFLDIFQTAAGNNDTAWSNPAYDSLLAQARKESDRSKRMALYEQAEKILLDDMPIMPLGFYTNPRLVSPRVVGYKAHPRGVVLFRYMDVR